MVEQVKAKMIEAFHHFNKKDGIEIKNIKIKITSQFGKISYFLLKGNEQVRKTEFDEMISGLNFLIKGMAKSEFEGSVNKVIAEGGVPQNSANIIISPDNNHNPLVYLFNNNQEVKLIELEKLLN